MWDKDIIVVTDEKTCIEPLVTRIDRLLKAPITAILLRRKEVSPKEYAFFLNIVKQKDRTISFIAHHHIGLAQRFGYSKVQASLEQLRQHQDQLSSFSAIGASIHSVEEAKEAFQLGATYLVAGHIFPTSCKAFLPPRGRTLLENILATVPLPLYAIGGITLTTLPQLVDLPLKGVCIMSTFMSTPNPIYYAQQLRSIDS